MPSTTRARLPKTLVLAIAAMFLGGANECQTSVNADGFENSEITIHGVGDVSGAVIDSVSERPVSGATVSLTGKQSPTGVDGTFFISGVPTGTSLLSIIAEGYDLTWRNVTVEKGANSVGAIAIVPSSDGSGGSGG